MSDSHHYQSQQPAPKSDTIANANTCQHMPGPLQSSYLDFNYLVPTSHSRFSIKYPPVEEL
ncbi:hypothetical protein K503DRAFT_771659, partial [Rhizopogon vinicolor AM-OR11-026]